MSSVVPLARTIAGEGKPRILVDTDEVFSSVATTFTATSVAIAGGVDLNPVRPGMRATSWVAATAGSPGLPAKMCYGRITAVDNVGDTITVAEWIGGGTPTNGQELTVDGWVIDLPYCGKLTEYFDPDVLVHELYGGDRGSSLASKFRGWKYSAHLDYSRYVSADTLMMMRYALSRDVNKGMTLIPRVDAPGFNYRVHYGGQVALALFGQTPGYTGPVFVFIGEWNVAGFPMNDGYGYNYGSNYGHGL